MPIGNIEVGSAEPGSVVVVVLLYGYQGRPSLAIVDYLVDLWKNNNQLLLDNGLDILNIEDITDGNPSQTTQELPTSGQDEIEVPNEDGGGVNAGLIVGILFGVLGGIGLIAGSIYAAFFISRRFKRNAINQEQESIIMNSASLSSISDEQKHSSLYKLERLLLSSNFDMIRVIVKVTDVTESDKVAKCLTFVFASRQMCVDLIKSLIAWEVDDAKHAGSLMRANSMASKVIKSYSGIIGKTYLRNTLAKHVANICENPVDGGCSFEVDPSKRTPEDGDLEASQEKLRSVCSKILRTIFDSLDDAPFEFRQICNCLQKTVSDKFPGSAQTCIGGFLFLRFFCPAIMTPAVYGLIGTSPSPAAQRGLTLIAKTLQNVANNVAFGQKEPFMVFLNEFITVNFNSCQDFFDEMSTIPMGVKKDRKSKRKTLAETEDLVDNEKKMESLEYLVTNIRKTVSKYSEEIKQKEFYPSLEEILRELETNTV